LGNLGNFVLVAPRKQANVMRLKLKDVLKKEESRGDKTKYVLLYLVTLVACPSKENVITSFKLKDVFERRRRRRK
jgi:hypothetical protein